MRLQKSLAIASALATTAFAQTYTSCNPTENSSCPADTALSSSIYSVDFTQGASDNWTVTAGSISYTSSGAEFTINESGDAPTIETDFYIFFGSISVFMRAANGTGIVSSAILESDDLDEIDWEWLGGSVDEVETNYFGKGNTTSYDRATYVDVDDSQTTTHNYTIHWTSAATTWYIDGNAVRTLNYADAVSGKNYPQTPMRIRLGIWAGGDSGNDEGTISWAGGETDYSDAPFTMTVEKVEIVNYTPATSYSYGDTTGDWTSIDVENGTTNSNSGGNDSTATATTAGDGSNASSTSSSMWWTASASAIIAAAQASSGSTKMGGDVASWSIAMAVVCFVLQFLQNELYM